MTENNDTVEIDSVSLRLPIFWINNIDGWFVHVESVFEARKITRERTKFNHLLSALDEKTNARVADLFSKVPADTPYTYLKEAILERFQLTEDQRIRMLLDMAPSDRRPSEQLQYMRSIYNPDCTCRWFRCIFLRSLAPEVALAFSYSKETNLDLLARDADDYAASLANRLAAARATRGFSEPAADISNVSRPASAKSRPTADQRDDLCYYHRNFGKKAQKCRKPCAFPSEN